MRYKKRRKMEKLKKEVKNKEISLDFFRGRVV